MSDVFKLPQEAEIHKLNIHQRMLLARKVFRFVTKKKVSGMTHAVVEHDAVTVLARRALDSVFVNVVPGVKNHTVDGNRASLVAEVTFVNSDDPDDRYTVTMASEATDRQDKASGKANSYGIKFCYLKAFMAETGVEEESEIGAVEYAGAPTRESLVESIRNAIRTNKDLDGDYVLWRIEDSYGDDWNDEENGMGLDMLACLTASVEDEPDSWMKPEGWTKPKKEVASV